MEQELLRAVQHIVLKELSISPTEEKNLLDIFAKYEIGMPEELISFFIDNQLKATGFANNGGKSVYDFQITNLGIDFLKNIEDATSGNTEKTLMPSIKAFNDIDIPKVLHESLVGSDPTMEVPFITYGYDTTNAFVSISKEDNEINIDKARQLSKENLSGIEVEVNELDLAGIPMIVCAGNYYASEKILDEEFMMKLQNKLQTELLAVSLPRKGFMFVTNGVQSSSELQKFLMITTMKYNEAEQTKPLSKQIFIVQDGKVNGLIQFDKKEASSEKPSNTSNNKKSFWKRLFKLN